MKVVLVLPPLAWPFSPYLGLPTLAAYLRGLGHRVTQFDANLRLFDRVFSRAGLEQLRLAAQDRFRQLESRPALTPLEQEEYLDLVELLSVLPRYLARIEAVKAAFKDIDRYRLRPDGTVALEGDWFDYKTIRHLVFPDETNPLRLPVVSLERFRAAVEGRPPLPYQPFLEELAGEIAALGPDLVGFSLTFGEQAIPGLVLARLVKDRLPHVHLVMGGFYFSAVRDGLERILPSLGFVDSVVLGEGEAPLASLAAALERGGSLDQVPGLVRVERGAVRGNPPPPPLDLDELPCPDFEGLPLQSYFAARPVLPYATARGCYWGRCAFCSFCLVSQRFRVRSPGLVARDLARLARAYGALFYLAQEAEPPRRMEAIAQALLSEGAPVRYQLFARFEKTFTARTAEYLRRSGCLYVFFGLEAGSERVNRLMRKGVDLQEAKRIVADCAAAGLNVVVSSIRGFPTETREE
ncbi:MAG: radical SAM protein, partial [Acetobacteraceae bacterium]|nr:radical SAM protein [Acetobacteraceae bacterium]